MKIGDKLEDGWEVIIELTSGLGSGFIIAKPYNKENIAKLGGRQFALISEGKFRFSSYQQCKLMKLVLEEAKFEGSYKRERKKFEKALNEIKFRGVRNAKK